MVSAGSEIHFEVAKQMAMLNGLDSWLKKSEIAQNSDTQRVIPPFEASNVSRSIHGRSISASELYSQADTASLASSQGSAYPPNIPPHQYGRNFL